MAGLRLLKNKYYARVRYKAGHKYFEKLVPLRTDSKVEARKRILKVNRVEHEIVSGIDYSFPWMNERKELTVNVFTLQMAIDDYLKFLTANNRRATTVSRAHYCLKNLVTVLGPGFCFETITTGDIERFKAKFKGELADSGININLTRIRAFINWGRNIKGIIKTKPIVMMLKVPYKLPAYLNEAEQLQILELEWLDAHYKDVFKFYWETGCRLREAFTGKIMGEWLEVASEDSKTGIPREIHLKPHHIAILADLQDKMQNSKALPRTFSVRYSNVFKKACKAIDRGDLHFHNLRDTFAVMRYLETRDIYQVSKELGHSSVKVTEKYAKFNLSRLEQDFPVLAQGYNQKSTKKRFRDTEFRDTEWERTFISEGKSAAYTA